MYRIQNPFPIVSRVVSKQHDLLFHFVKDQMLCNDREMTVKKVLVNPNDDAKGDDDRATTNCNESLSFPALLPISLTFLRQN